MATLPGRVVERLVVDYDALIAEEAIEIDERTHFGRPSIWVRMGSDAEAFNHWETLTTLLLDLRAHSHDELLDLEKPLAWLSKAVFVGEADDEMRVARFDEPTVTRGREPQGWVASYVYPVTYARAREFASG